MILIVCSLLIQVLLKILKFTVIRWLLKLKTKLWARLFIQPGASPKGSSDMAKNDKRVEKSDELGQGSNQNNIVGFPLEKSFHSFSVSESEVPNSLLEMKIHVEGSPKATSVSKFIKEPWKFVSISASRHVKFLNIAKVYSANAYIARRSLWKNLSNLQDSL
ncbi:hypothetical protein VNO80_10411 [Phaseolus coccineus]|uniref:Uncharacterized protein n=1 Tax=Phaseolus coccineus TaxID=3886 RepID=A0AAN9N8L7_PHACN